MHFTVFLCISLSFPFSFPLTYLKFLLVSSEPVEPAVTPAVDTNLIQLDDDEDDADVERRLNGAEDDDFIFEDFARLRLKGHDNDEADA